MRERERDRKDLVSNNKTEKQEKSTHQCPHLQFFKPQGI